MKIQSMINRKPIPDGEVRIVILEPTGITTNGSYQDILYYYNDLFLPLMYNIKGEVKGTELTGITVDKDLKEFFKYLVLKDEYLSKNGKIQLLSKENQIIEKLKQYDYDKDFFDKEHNIEDLGLTISDINKILNYIPVGFIGEKEYQTIHSERSNKVDGQDILMIGFENKGKTLKDMYKEVYEVYKQVEHYDYNPKSYNMYSNGSFQGKTPASEMNRVIEMEFLPFFNSQHKLYPDYAFSIVDILEGNSYLELYEKDKGMWNLIIYFRLNNILVFPSIHVQDKDNKEILDKIGYK